MLSFARAGAPSPPSPLRGGFELSRIESGGPLSGAVLTVPIDASPAVRRALRDDALATGLARVRLLPAPVAAALASLRRGEASGAMLVLDMGQTGFSAAVLLVDAAGVSVVSTGSAPVGGDVLDAVVARQLAELWGPDAGPDVHAAAAREARRARHELSEQIGRAHV